MKRVATESVWISDKSPSEVKTEKFGSAAGSPSSTRHGGLRTRPSPTNMADQATAATYESELARFTACGQQHVFRFWKTLNAEQQAKLLAEAQVLYTSR